MGWALLYIISQNTTGDKGTMKPQCNHSKYNNTLLLPTDKAHGQKSTQKHCRWNGLSIRLQDVPSNNCRKHIIFSFLWNFSKLDILGYKANPKYKNGNNLYLLRS
jgi:hypothetical protein